MGKWRYSSTHPYLSTRGGEWSASSPDRFIPGEIFSGSHLLRGWVGPRASLNTVANRKILYPCRESKWNHPSVIKLSGINHTQFSKPSELVLWRISYCDLTVPCICYSVDADGLQLQSVAADMVNKQSRTADKGVPPNLGGGGVCYEISQKDGIFNQDMVQWRGFVKKVINVLVQSAGPR
jgi:hypothetical protein